MESEIKEELQKYITKQLGQKMLELTSVRTEQELTFYQGQIFNMKKITVDFGLDISIKLNLEQIYDHVKKETGTEEQTNIIQK